MAKAGGSTTIII